MSDTMTTIGVHSAIERYIRQHPTRILPVLTIFLIVAFALLPPLLESEVRNFLYTGYTQCKHNPNQCIIIGISVFLVSELVLAPRHRRNISNRASDRAWFGWVWETPRWLVIAGLCELYMLGAVPHAFWGDGAGRSLQEWEDKRYLRALLRMGIIPLRIQDGGLDTRTKTEEEKMGYRVQGNKRACFHFMVPMGSIWHRVHQIHRATCTDEERRRMPFANFILRLRTNDEGIQVVISGRPTPSPMDYSRGYPDHVAPLEAGASSPTEYVLPFKRDRILMEGKGKRHDTLVQFSGSGQPIPRLLEGGGYPIVRVEVPNNDRLRLDEWVYEMALDGGLREMWNPDDMRLRTVRWCRHLGMKVSRVLRPPRRG
jgi:hypothetical protein